MRKIFRTVAALAVVLFAGCTQDLENEVVAPVGGTTVTVGLEDSRTYLGDLVDGTRKVFWSSDDKIAVNGVASTAIERTEDHTSANFTFDGELAYPYSILYPAEAYKDASTVTLATNDIPMAGYLASEGSAVLHHLAAVVRLQVKLPAESTHAVHKLNKVEIRGVNGEQMVGDFTIDYQTETLVGASTADADKVKVANVGKTLSAEEAIEVFVVVPAQEYAGGISVRLIDDAGHYMDVKSAAMTLEKGGIKAMPVLEFVPTGTIIGVEIKTAADLVAFAKDYNAGKYIGVEPFVVNITEDIVFDETTSAEWEPIGNVFADESTNYWHGYLEGNGHSIKNWVSSRPLFAYTGGGSMVTNLTIDASCTLTANYKDEVAYYGTLVGYHRGELVNCVNNANIAASGAWTGDAYVAGLVGRCVVGSVKDCVMTGTIAVDETFLVGGTIYIGGNIGRISNAEGSINNSRFEGTISFAGGSSATSKKAYIGGIVGLASGDVIGCSTTTGDRITAEHATNNVHTFYLGGIVGYADEGVSVLECENNRGLYIKYQRNSDKTRYIYVGGVAGYIAANALVKDCNNVANAQVRSCPKSISIGGIAGHIVADATLENCENSGEITARTSSAGSHGGRYLSIGGVIGACATSNVSNIANSGTVETSRSESNATARVCIGGCIGELLAPLDGQNTISNSGTISNTDGATNHSFLGLGGVVGVINKAGANLSNVSNSGAVTDGGADIHNRSFAGGVVGLINQPATVSNVSNTGKISFTNKTAMIHVNTAMGGIVGAVANYLYDTTAAVVVETPITATIQNATNSGGVIRSSMAKQNGSHFYAGGIVGILRGAGSTVTNCTNSGRIEVAGTNNNCYDANLLPTNATGSFCAGGIVGFGCGEADNAVVISNCTNTSEYIRTGRGYGGGIAGYVRCTAISNCDCNTIGKVKGTNTNNRIGGIAGYIHTTSVTSCNVVATVDGVNTAYTGGISGGMNATSSIVSSTVNGTVTISEAATNAVGAITAMSEEGATITNCGAKGKIGFQTALADITVDQFDGGGKATVTGSYILD